ncbi:uncharacterized protein EAF01_004475 [Botrytis porri]|uniref:Carrier domain-containing protein n=1 Tax=Botrytis porri TaxID=87229 RepID=A0A4Z1K9G9_9HELO|nr:uncharacterized protein EAF01_004475 [Botrytis porri]KAF7908720.1 hypothetical protein EAF01_004475 [Botrytis porri]TGO82753.1 hypothetical protein BPOR_0766g00050 [Botrytis porri]
MENAFNSHPEVKSAIVYGTKKFQSSLLVEPVNIERSKKSLLDESLPTIKTANISCPAHARMNRDITNGNSSVDKGASSDVQGTIIQTISNLEGFENLSLSDNFFEHGLDSLGMISLTKAINSVFKSQNPPRDSIRDPMIHAYPSPEKLARALSNSAEDGNEDHGEMQEEYECFISDLPIVARPSTLVIGPKVSLLTESTRSLGSYILSNLLEEDKTCKVYCLNRGEDIEKRQLTSSSSKGLFTDFSRVRLLSIATGDTEAWLGIKLYQYKELLNEVTHIIHNAWHVDFNVSFSQMSATRVRRVRQLIESSAHSRFGPSIHFISSMSTVGSWDEQGWLPLILKLSKYLKVLPSSLGPLGAVDWIPVDVLRKVVYELVTSSKHGTLKSNSTIESSSGLPRVYHIVNPKRTTYSDAMLPRLQSRSSHYTLPRIGTALKILEFYEGLVEKEKEGRTQVWLDTEKAVEGSSTLTSMDPIDGDCVNNRMRQWGYVRNVHAE